ncbi:MAG: DMP19 family protein [Firmicutes bacterium]|nr:DMP19 family protein [Bacillota bacterium]
MFGLFRKKKKKQAKQPAVDCSWNRFVDWCCNNDKWNGANNYGAANTDLPNYEKAVYYLFWIQSEVNNGGYQQFFMNKKDWKHDKMHAIIKEYLPTDLYKNHMKAYADFKKDEFETAEMVGEPGYELYAPDKFWYDNEEAFMKILEEMADKLFALVIVNDKFLQFENDIMEKMVASEDPALVEILTRQYKSATVTSRDFTGVGLYTNFEIADKELRIPKTAKRPMGKFMAKVNGMLADILLWEEDGLINSLELVTMCDDQFPRKIETYEFE